MALCPKNRRHMISVYHLAEGKTSQNNTTTMFEEPDKAFTEGSISESLILSSIGPSKVSITQNIFQNLCWNLIIIHAVHVPGLRETAWIFACLSLKNKVLVH